MLFPVLVIYIFPQKRSCVNFLFAPELKNWAYTVSQEFQFCYPWLIQQDWFEQLQPANEIIDGKSKLVVMETLTKAIMPYDIMPSFKFFGRESSKHKANNSGLFPNEEEQSSTPSYTKTYRVISRTSFVVPSLMDFHTFGKSAILIPFRGEREYDSSYAFGRYCSVTCIPNYIKTQAVSHFETYSFLNGVNSKDFTSMTD